MTNGRTREGEVGVGRTGRRGVRPRRSESASFLLVVTGCSGELIFIYLFFFLNQSIDKTERRSVTRRRGVESEGVELTGG